jgi:hypothetical protein
MVRARARAALRGFWSFLGLVEFEAMVPGPRLFFENFLKNTFVFFGAF